MVMQATGSTLKVSKADVWVAPLEDRPGGLHEKLQTLSDAGADLAFAIARRSADKAGEGAAFVTPIRGTKQLNAARKAGFHKREHQHTLRVEGPNQPGLGAEITRAVADAGLNMHGLSAAAIGEQSVVYLAFDSADDANKAARALRKL